MDRPFFNNCFRGIPVDPVQRKAKVVSIPVHFVGSETIRLASALKIQKVFRGFAVRRSVKKINSIRGEVEEIERRTLERETVELIRRENKERLRLNETLMALLFKLDSVRGVDSGVRDFRKAVIKKAIALQERVDAIATGNQALEVEDLAERQNLGIEGKESGIKSSYSNLIDGDNNQASEIKQFVEVFVDADNGDNQIPTIAAEEPGDKDEVDANNHCSKKSADESGEVRCPEGGEPVDETKDDEKMDFAEGRVVSEVKDDEEDCIVKQIVEEQFPTNEFVEGLAEKEPRVSVGIGGENISERRTDRIKLEGDYQKRNAELLERMMEDNEKIMGLMTQLCERNETQTRMLSSLTRRVEQLERAVICDRLRKKKRRHAVGTADCLESTPDENKGGKT